jgi:hypothetical protein
MTDERPTQGGLELTPEDIAALRQRYRPQDVIDLFGLLSLPVCDDGAIIVQVAARDKSKRQQDSLSANTAQRKQAAAWLTADELLENPASRRELLLIIQEDVNRMYTFRIERLGRDFGIYTPEVRAELRASAMRGFKLSEDLAERFMRAFEHASNLRFGARAPMVVPPIDARASAPETFASTLTTLLPPLPSAVRAATMQSTEPVLPAVRIKPPARRASTSLPASDQMLSTPPPTSERRPSAPLLLPANATARLVFERDGQTEERLLTGEVTTIGRLPESDICLKEDLRVSREHAVIHRAPTAFLLTDLGSGNGTYLNGVPLDAPAILHSGDLIRVGHTELTFLMEPRTDQQRS